MTINTTNTFYEIHKGLEQDRSQWYTLISTQTGSFVLYEYHDNQRAENDQTGYKIIPADDFLNSNNFDATAQLKLRRLLASSLAA